MKVIALESCNRLSLGLFDNKNIINKAEFYDTDIADTLLLKIKEFLAINKTKSLDLNGVAVVVGPGSFTGIRSVVLVAKILRLILKIPVLPVNALHLLHQNALRKRVFNDNDLILCTLSVGNSGIALALFDNNQNEVEKTQFVLFSDLEDFLLKFYAKNIYVIGSGMDKLKNLDKNYNLIYLEDIIHPNIEDVRNFFSDFSFLSLNTTIEPLYITQPNIIIKNYGLK